MTRNCRLLAVFAWSAFLLGSLVAQTNLGRIVGTARDSTGAVVPDVTITVRNEGTGWTREFQTLETGDYEIANLVAGRYAVRAERSGFRRFLQSGIVLDAGRTVRVDVRLDPGELVQEIQVAASVPLVETETPSISSRIEYELQIKSPVSTGNRPWESLASLPTFQSGASAFVYTIAGSRGAQNEFHIDGIASVGADSPLGSTSMTTAAAQELKVQAVNNSAEYSQPGIYQQISRSGTNQFHGEIRYFHSNSALNARSFFSPTKPPSRDHKFGLWAAVPLQVPRLYRGRDRTFWMLAYEGARTPGFKNVNATVPTAAMRSGDFSTAARALKDPLGSQPFPDNRIPAARISPVSQKLQDRFYPLPNFGSLTTLTPLNHRILFDSPGRSDHADLRLDHQFTADNTIYARVGYMQFPVRNMEGNLPTIGLLSRLRELWNMVISDTHVFSPTFINEARAGMTRSYDPAHGPQRGLEVLAAVGIQGIQNVPDTFGMPVVNITGLSSLTQSQQFVMAEQGAQLSDSVTWIRGRHTVKAGLDTRRAFPNITTVPVGTYGACTFTNAFTGDAYADFLLGLPQTTERTYPAPGDYRRYWQLGLFVQDDFRLSPRLTLQAGLRYEYQRPTNHLMDALYNFDPASGALILASQRAQQFVSRLFNPTIPIGVADGSRFPIGQLWNSDRNNFGPRLGLAFRPTASADFAVRAGYGIFYDTFGYGIAGNQTGGPLTPGSERFTSLPGALLQFPRPFPDTPGGPSTARPIVNAVIVNVKNPYVQQWNLTVEKEKAGIGLRASYVGTKGTGLLLRRNINLPLPGATPFDQSRRPYPVYQDIFLGDQGGNSIYHGLQMEAIRRFGSLTFDLGYAWSNTISDVVDAGADIGGPMENPYDRRAERARESYAIKHRFTMNAIWRIPVGKGRSFLNNLHPVANHVLGGWETIWTGYLQSGDWFTPAFTGSDPSNTNTIGGRPDCLADGNLSDPTLARWFDASAFAVPPANAGRFGNCGRNVLRGPGSRILHTGLAKDFPIHENMKATLEVAARNVFNHPAFAPPAANISSAATVGRITGLRSDLLAGGARTVDIRFIVSW